MKTRLLLFLLLLSVASYSQDKKRCTAIAKSTKEQCRNAAKAGKQFCTIHDPATPRCGVLTREGKPCTRITKNGAKCWQHE